MTGNYIGNNPNGLDIVLSDDYETNKSQLIASTKCVNNVYNNLKELIDSKGEGGLPLGHIYLWPFNTPPDGSIQVNGSEYNRELYSDLWALIQEKNWYKPESEWQSIAAANGGYCPWYSDGDGSTTFRTPKFAPYQKLALASGDAGKYYEAGLPNAKGSVTAMADRTRWVSFRSFSGAIQAAGSSNPAVSDEYYTHYIGGYNGFTVDLSKSNSIYGNSTTVQPESHDWIVCVVAFGTATNVGSVDVANVMSAVGQVQADISNVVRAGMPNWDAAISVPIENNYTYTTPSDGFLLFSVQGTTNGASLRVSINGVDYNFTSPGTNNVDYEHFCFTILPMVKGTICKIVEMSRIVAHFLPAYGV